MKNINRIQAMSFSKYRSELMGVATVLVLIVHSFTCRVSYFPTKYYSFQIACRGRYFPVAFWSRRLLVLV